jgi:hypothetical protein
LPRFNKQISESNFLCGRAIAGCLKKSVEPQGTFRQGAQIRSRRTAAGEGTNTRHLSMEVANGPGHSDPASKRVANCHHCDCRSKRFCVRLEHFAPLDRLARKRAYRAGFLPWPIATANHAIRGCVSFQVPCLFIVSRRVPSTPRNFIRRCGPWPKGVMDESKCLSSVAGWAARRATKVARAFRFASSGQKNLPCYGVPLMSRCRDPSGPQKGARCGFGGQKMVLIPTRIELDPSQGQGLCPWTPSRESVLRTTEAGPPDRHSIDFIHKMVLRPPALAGSRGRAPGLIVSQTQHRSAKRARAQRPWPFDGQCCYQPVSEELAIADRNAG